MKVVDMNVEKAESLTAESSLDSFQLDSSVMENPSGTYRSLGRIMSTYTGASVNHKILTVWMTTIVLHGN